MAPTRHPASLFSEGEEEETIACTAFNPVDKGTIHPSIAQKRDDVRRGKKGEEALNEI